MSSPVLPPHRRRAALTALVLAGLLALQLAALRRLEYSRAWLASMGIGEARAAGTSLSLGGLRWEPDPYVAAPSLAPFRNLVAQHCPERGGVDTASCLGDLFSQRFAHGAPPIEFFAAGYVPTQALAEHLAGTPGHCVSRSGLLATALLASGFPARVVQLVPHEGSGHNVVEVLDPGRGWVLMDPTYGFLIDAPGGHAAVDALAAPHQVRWRFDPAMRPAVALPRTEAAQRASADRLITGDVVYPDPWLYTRVGRSSAPAPFQGRFLIVGRRSLALGLGQPLLQASSVLSLLALALMVAGGLRRRSARTEVPVGEGQKALPVERSHVVLPGAHVVADERPDAVTDRGRSAGA
jgi:hypothetical protein